MNYNMMSKESIEELTLYMNNFIPQSLEYGMPEASSVIDINLLFATFNNDETFLTLIRNQFGEEVFTNRKLNFDELILNKKILLNKEYFIIINSLIIELYFTSHKVQSILTNMMNTLLINNASIGIGNLSLTNQVKKNFNN